MKTIKHGGLVGAVILAVSNLFVKVFGLLREILMANFYGTGDVMDAYIIANSIPTVLFAAIGAALAAVFCPMYLKIKADEGHKAANGYTIKLIKLSVLVGLSVTIIGELFSGQIVTLFAFGFQGTKYDMTVEFVRILFPSFIAMMMFTILGCYLQSNEDYKAIAIVPVVGNLAIIISLFLSSYFNSIYVFVCGTLLGISFQVIYYVPDCKKYGLFSKNESAKYKKNYIRESVMLFLPVFIGSAANDVNLVVSKTLVSGLNNGGVSALNYGFKILTLVISVGMGSITTVIYPKMSNNAANKNEEYFSVNCNIAMMVTAGLLLPATAYLIILRTDIVRILFQRGSFDSVSTLLVSKALVCYCLGLIGVGGRDMLSKILYSIRDTKYVMKNGIICSVINIPLSIALIEIFGFTGAAISFSIVATLGFINLLWKCFRLRVIKFDTLRGSLAKTVISTAVTSVGLYVTYVIIRQYLEFGLLYIIILLLAVAFWLCTYLAIQYILKNDFITYFFRKARL